MRPWGRVLSAVGLVSIAVAGSAQELQRLSAPPPPVREAPGSFGPSDSYVTVGEWEFTPPFSAYGVADTTGNQPMKYTTTAGGFFNAAVHIPSGALLTYFEFDYCDDNPTQDLDMELYNTTYLNTTINQLATVTSSGTPGCTYGSYDMSPFGIVVDDYHQRLVIQMGFGQSTDSTTRFAGAIIGYRLQVSPAPGTATFNDVPTSHPFFQYVEALNAAGITGGCGNGNYCPDAPVTRGQMAVFLSKALGLYWSY